MCEWGEEMCACENGLKNGMYICAVYMCKVCGEQHVNGLWVDFELNVHMLTRE